MNLGITELIFICGIVGLLALVTAMIAGFGARFLRQANKVHEQTPLDILKMRYARGEITREQFEEIKRDLT